MQMKFISVLGQTKKKRKHDRPFAPNQLKVWVVYSDPDCVVSSESIPSEPIYLQPEISQSLEPSPIPST